MRRTLAVCLFVIATFTWALAQTGSATPGAQPPSAGAQSSGATQSQAPSASAGQDPAQSAAPITQGCLAGSNGAYTITDTAGKTYKLNFPPNANVSVLSSHIGESVAVMGDVQGSGKSGQSINVSRIGRGSSTCSAGSSATPQSPKR